MERVQTFSDSLILKNDGRITLMLAPKSLGMRGSGTLTLTARIESDNAPGDPLPHTATFTLEAEYNPRRAM